MVVANVRIGSRRLAQAEQGLHVSPHRSRPQGASPSVTSAPLRNVPRSARTSSGDLANALVGASAGNERPEADHAPSRYHDSAATTASAWRRFARSAETLCLMRPKLVARSPPRPRSLGRRIQLQVSATLILKHLAEPLPVPRKWATRSASSRMVSCSLPCRRAFCFPRCMCCKRYSASTIPAGRVLRAEARAAQRWSGRSQCSCGRGRTTFHGSPGRPVDSSDPGRGRGSPRPAQPKRNSLECHECASGIARTAFLRITSDLSMVEALAQR